MGETSQPRLLVLSGKNTSHVNIAQLLAAQFDVQTFETMDEAIRALRDEDFHAIFADVGDFLPMERSLAGQQASVVLDTIGEGVMVVDTDGRCSWSNRRMRAFTADVIERAKSMCNRARSLFVGQIRASEEIPTSLSKKFTFQAENDRYFELICSPVIDERGSVQQIVAVVWDASRGKRLEQKINAIDRAGRELAKLESERISKLSPSQRLEVLRDKIIKYSKELMNFDHFAIRVVDKRSNRLELVIAEGLPQEAMEIDLYASPEGNGISGYVAATGRSYICHDTEKDPRYILGIEHCMSSLTVPLRLYDSVIGVFNIESQKIGAFDEDDRQFAEIFGQYIAIALNVLNLMIVERCNVSGVLADNVVQEMAQPLNDIITEAQSLVEDYIGDDTMRTRLNSILDHVESIRASVRSVAAGTATVFGAENVKADNHDPLLSGKQILIADDEVNIRQTLSDVLSKYGCKVTICKDGYEACHLLEQQDYDLVISDIKMPHRNGYEIFAAAQRRNEEMPVILMTGFGYDPHHSIVRASQEGLSCVLFKPFKVDQMLDEVRKALSPEQDTEDAKVESPAS